MDVAAVTIAYLAQATGIPWHHDRPKHAPTEVGTLTRDGGPTTLFADRPTLTLMVYAGTRGRAADLAELTKHALLTMQWEQAAVFGCEVLGDYYDPLDGLHRHRITAQLTVSD